MILSRSAEYALRVMALMALRSAEGGATEPLRAKDIAGDVNIPAFYLSKILRRVAAAGLLIGSKGHGGGFILARPPEQIRFIDILEAIEGVSGPTPCVFGLDACDNANPCVLHHRWKELKKNFVVWASETTLGDVKKDMKRLRDPNLAKFLPPDRLQQVAKQKNRKLGG